MTNETLIRELVDALRAADAPTSSVAAEAVDGYVKVPTELWNEIMDIYDTILAEEAAQK